MSRVAFLQNPVVAMSDHAGTSSARRRRERRLRSWLRHERMTVAMELAAATHHSSPKGGWPDTTHDALRGQKTASSAGVHPVVLKEPEVHWEAATVGYVAAPGLLLSVPVLAGGDGVDGTALSFLVRRAVEDRKKEEEEKEKEKARKKKEAQEKADLERRHEGDGAGALQTSLFGIFVQAEEEEVKEEADASYLLSSWPRSSSTTTVVRLQCWFYW